MIKVIYLDKRPNGDHFGLKCISGGQAKRKQEPHVNPADTYLINYPIGADGPCDFLLVSPKGYQLGLYGHINAVDVGVTDGRRGRTEEDLLRPSGAHHLNDLLGSRTSHDGVVYKHHVLVLKNAVARVELLTNVFFSLLLPGHDECASDVPILVQALLVGDPQFNGALQGGDARGLRHWNYHVDF